MPPDTATDVPTINDTHYVPILKGRAAEYDALEALTDSQKAALTPLVELMPIPWDVENNRASTNGDEHIANAERGLLRAWGTIRPILLDLLWLGPEARTLDGKHPMAFMLQRAAAAGIKVIPVVSVDCDAEYREAVRDGQTGYGVGLRLTSGDLARDDASDVIQALLNDVRGEPQSADLIIDLKALNPAAVDFNVMGAMGVVAAVPNATTWRSLILSGSAFPQNLSEMQPASEKRFPRTEWTVWSKLRGRGLSRTPAFSDYGIAHPDLPPSIDPKLLRVSAQLRYTTDKEWLVFKERNIRDFGNGQFIQICERLVKMEEYRGVDFSWGDAYISQRANGTDSRPGNPRMWRKVGTSHHLATVVSQIASLDT
jgi:hypothetical protein